MFYKFVFYDVDVDVDILNLLKQQLDLCVDILHCLIVGWYNPTIQSFSINKNIDFIKQARLLQV